MASYGTLIVELSSELVRLLRRLNRSVARHKRICAEIEEEITGVALVALREPLDPNTQKLTVDVAHGRLIVEPLSPEFGDPPC